MDSTSMGNCLPGRRKKKLKQLEEITGVTVDPIPPVTSTSYTIPIVRLDGNDLGDYIINNPNITELYVEHNVSTPEYIKYYLGGSALEEMRSRMREFNTLYRNKTETYCEIMWSLEDLA